MRDSFFVEVLLYGAVVLGLHWDCDWYVRQCSFVILMNRY